MSGKSMSLGVLAAVAIACLGYAIFQYAKGEPDDAPPLVIGAVVCGTLIVALRNMKQKS